MIITYLCGSGRLPGCLLLLDGHHLLEGRHRRGGSGGAPTLGRDSLVVGVACLLLLRCRGRVEGGLGSFPSTCCFCLLLLQPNIMILLPLRTTVVSRHPLIMHDNV